MWNCRKGLVDKENLPTAKINDVKDFIRNNDLQVMCFIEADLHGMTSRIRRVNPITSKKIEENLKVKIIEATCKREHVPTKCLL